MLHGDRKRIEERGMNMLTTIHDVASMMNGREYGNEITKKEEEQLRKLGFVLVFGHSDDNVELRGTIYDEIGAWEGTTLYFDKNGLLKNECDDDECPYYARSKESAKTIDVIWGEEGYSWIFKTDISHATFDILEDGEKFCRGIVFDIRSLKD
jgi:hypothetical protein